MAQAGLINCDGATVECRRNLPPLLAYFVKPHTLEKSCGRLIAFDPARGNTVFVRDEATVQARVASAKRTRLVNGTI
ncbi:MAG: hypothetical protein IPL96_02905 [Holophagaceae bacterium]|nr:hypothetical protein [Holophagaceae bacterium]